MVKVLKLKAEHLLELAAQEGNGGMRSFMTPAYAAELEKAEHAYSAVSESGRVVACAGIAKYWPGRAEGWAFFDRRCKRDFLSIHRAVRKFLDGYPVRRIEAAVESGFEAGHRWALALGFELEAPRMRAYTPEGRDCALYARVRSS